MLYEDRNGNLQRPIKYQYRLRSLSPYFHHEPSRSLQLRASHLVRNDLLLYPRHTTVNTSQVSNHEASQNLPTICNDGSKLAVSLDIVADIQSQGEI